MPNYCENCGCKVFSGKCTNCHEELFILDQYDELGMEYPDDDSEFMRKVKEHNLSTSQQRNIPPKSNKI